MKNITYISASAGSGKTYAITTSLTDIILKGMAEPEQAILTTFTKAAAAELKEKAKAKLCENGLYEQAERLEQAMIGTAHSVAESFIKKYWHILGLSPELNVMTDEDVKFYRNQSLYTVPTGEELSFLHKFAEEFGIPNDKKNAINYDFWKEHLEKIIEYSINYDITDYKKSKEESKKLITSLCEAGLKRENLPDDEEIRNTIQEISEKNPNITKTQQNNMKGALKIIRHDKLSLYEIYDLFTITSKFTEDMKGDKEDFFQSLSRIMNTEDARDLQLEYIDIIFAIARRWKESFEQYKKEKRLIDYSDMEKYFMALLKNEEVKKDIKAKYKYLFVDEFQDCSQNQVKIFDTISDLMEHSYWVGDFKQSIYGFRGTDTKLSQAVADIVKQKENSSLDTLKTSYRSLPVLVEAANKIFISAFRNTMDKEQVELSPCDKKKKEDFKEESLRFLPLEGENKAENFVLLANYIAGLVKKGIMPKEIAFLARNNRDFYDDDKNISLPILLRHYGIPVNNAGKKQLSVFSETDFLLALLSLIANNNDSLAKAKILFYTQKNYDPAKIANIFIKKEEITENEIISKIISNKDYKKLPVNALVQSLIIDLNLSYEIRKCPLFVNPEIFDIIAEYASEYEQSCMNLSVPATIEGFIEKVKQISLETNGEDNGVTLTTYHGSKGLEWKYVILYSLDSKPVDTTEFIRKNIYGIRTIHEKPTSSCLYPETSIILLPWAYGSKKKVPCCTSTLLNNKYPGLDKDIAKNINSDEGWPYTEIAKEKVEEEKRLMYVGMTRASHCLILAVKTKQVDVEEKKGRKKKGEPEIPKQDTPKKTVLQLDWLKQIGINAIPEIGSVNDKSYDLLGINMPFYTETVPKMENWQYNPHNMEFTVNPAENTANYVLRDQSPSGQNGGDVNVNIIYPENYSAETKTERISLNVKNDEMDVAGSCIHDIFCVLEYINGEARNAKAAAIINDYGFAAEKIDPAHIVRAWDNLAKLLSEKYGMAAATYHELPFQYAKEGQIFTGSIDFVYELPENKVILVDYKSFPGRIEMIYEDKNGKKGTHYAGKYKGQFDCYEHALTAAGKTVIAKIIYYPVAGIAVEIKDAEH